MNYVEQAVIATMIHSPDHRQMLLDALTPDDFTLFRDMFVKAKLQHDQGTFFTSETLSGSSGFTRNDIDILAGEALYDMGDIESYVRILNEENTRRSIRENTTILSRMVSNSDAPLSDISGILRKIEDRINATDDSIALTPSEIFRRESKKVRKEQLLTGIDKVDYGLYKDVGLYRGDINVILADSGHGKTQWSQFLAGRLARKGYKGLWFQMEDYDVNTALALYKHAKDACDNVRIVDSVDDIEDIRRQCFSQKHNDELDFVVIDYIQEVYAQGRYDSRTLEINEITKVLKNIAKMLNVVVLVPSQVTISSYNRSGWQLEPKYSDAQWAQVIKNVAHCMTSVFRPNMVESLITTNSLGDVKVKGFANDTYYPYNSVFVKLVKSRRGEITHDRLMVEHRGEYGLALPEEKWNQHQSGDKPF